MNLSLDELFQEVNDTPQWRGIELRRGDQVVADFWWWGFLSDFRDLLEVMRTARGRDDVEIFMVDAIKER
jgi:hypothetical protein